MASALAGLRCGEGCVLALETEPPSKSVVNKMVIINLFQIFDGLETSQDLVQVPASRSTTCENGSFSYQFCGGNALFLENHSNPWSNIGTYSFCFKCFKNRKDLL